MSFIFKTFENSCPIFCNYDDTLLYKKPKYFICTRYLMPKEGKIESFYLPKKKNIKLFNIKLKKNIL